MFERILKIISGPEKIVEVVQPIEKQVTRNLNIRVPTFEEEAFNRHMRRAYDSASNNKLLADWSGSYATANDDVRGALIKSRARARDLENNNNYINKYLNTVVTNIVGSTGFNLQISVMETKDKQDTLANDLLEEGFKKWCRRGICEITNRFSFDELVRVVVRTTARDGEALVRRIRDPKINKFGYALQVIESDRLAINKNGKASNGNQIVMGIEIDNYARPVAYYIMKTLQSSSAVQSGDVERVPADQIFHIYKATRPEQYRGMPWAHSVMVALEMLAAFQYATLVKKRTEASIQGVYISPEGDGSPLADEEVDGELLQHVEPGQFSILPPGFDFKQFSLDTGVDSYPSYCKAILQEIATALGVSYPSLANDLEGVSFSSIRAGTLEERDNWMAIQELFVDSLMIPVYEDWLMCSLQNGALAYPTGSTLPISKYDKFNSASWRGRRWSWIDPSAEVKANLDAIRGGLKTRKEVMADQGFNVDDTFNQLEKEQRLAESKNIYLEDISAANDTTNIVNQTAKSLEGKLDSLERGFESFKSIPAPSQVIPNITVNAPEITLNPMVKMPGTKTVRTAVRDDRGLITSYEDEEVLVKDKE